MKIDLSDVLMLTGAGCAIGGLYLLLPALALVFLGLLLLAAGAARASATRGQR